MQRAASGGRPSSKLADNSHHQRIRRDEGSIQIAAHVTAMATTAVIAKSTVHMTGLLVVQRRIKRVDATARSACLILGRCMATKTVQI
jgi:hypothetical protein